MSTAESRILLIGEGPTAESALAALTERFSVCGVVRSTDDAVSATARESGIDVWPARTLSELESVLNRSDPELVVVSSYSRVIPARLLDRWGFINVHYAMLPAYRGRANVNWALINGEPEVGVSIHTIAPGLDAGAILYQESVPISAQTTIVELYDALNMIQRRVLGQAVAASLHGEQGRPQDESDASYGCSRNPDDGLIDWSATTEQIDRLVRALTLPFPAFTYFRQARLSVLRAEPVPDPARYLGRVPGRVVRVAVGDGAVDVLTGDGVIRIHQVEVGGRTLAASEVLRSVRDTLGITPSDLDALFELLRGVPSETSRIAHPLTSMDKDVT